MSPEQDVSSFGLLLRHYRLAAGLTQEGLADRARLSVRAVSNLERGLNQRPRKDTLALLAEALTLAPAEYAALVTTAQRPNIQLPARNTHTQSAPPLIGRTSELALIERLLGGEGAPLLLLAGEPGIGKSRLLQEAARKGRQGGWAVLEDGCPRRGGQDPYAPLLGALKRYIVGVPRNRLRTLLQGCAWLVRVLPELADSPIEPLPAWAVPPEQERRLLFEAIARFLSNAAGPAGTLLVLDDLQWAGADLLDLLAALVRGAGAPPLHIVGAYRDTEVLPSDLLAVTLTDLAGAGLADRCTPAPLAREEAEALLDRLLGTSDRVGPDLREQVVRRAAGVPFFVVSCARGLLAGGGAERVDRIPWDLAQSIQQRVAALPNSAHEVLGVASVVGRAVPAFLLIAAVACSEQEVLAVLDAACRAQLLLEDGHGAYRFAHDVIREVVEGDLGTARRMALHRRVAEALERGPGIPSIELLAYHFSHGGSHEKALLYLERAGDRARRQAAYAAAEGYYRELAELLDRVGQVREAARIGEKRGAVLKTAVRYEEALEVLERAAETYRAAGDLEGRGRTMAQVGLLRGLGGAPEEGRRQLQPLIELLKPHGPSPAFAALLATLAQLAVCSDTPVQVEGLAAAEQAIRIATAVGDDHTRADAEISRATLLFLMGRREAALRAWEDAIPLVEAVGDLSLLRAVLNNCGVVYILRGAIERSHTHMQYALEVAERLGDPAEIAFQLGNHGSTTYHLGDWPKARLYLEKAVSLHRSLAANKNFDLYLMAYTNALLGLGQLCLAEGMWDEASDLLDEIVTVAHRSGDRRSLQNAARLHAERDLQAGHPEEAPGYLIPVLDRADEEDMLVPWLRSLLAWAQAQLGEFPTAADTAEQAVGMARDREHQFVLVDVLHIQAMIALQAYCRQGAAAAVEEGLALARSMPYPYAEGRLLLLGGRLHLAEGEAERAHTRLEAALAIFRRLGARKDITATEQLLATLD